MPSANPLGEGLTARRSSVLTSVQSGKPVIVTGPAESRTNSIIIRASRN